MEFISWVYEQSWYPPAVLAVLWFLVGILTDRVVVQLTRLVIG